MWTVADFWVFYLEGLVWRDNAKRITHQAPVRGHVRDPKRREVILLVRKELKMDKEVVKEQKPVARGDHGLAGEERMCFAMADDAPIGVGKEFARGGVVKPKGRRLIGQEARFNGDFVYLRRGTGNRAEVSGGRDGRTRAEASR